MNPMSTKHDIEITIHGIAYLVYVSVVWRDGRVERYHMDWFRWEGAELVECQEPADTKLFHRLYLCDEAVWRELALDEEREERDEREYQRLCNTPENRWAEEQDRKDHIWIDEHD